jgi:magnesium chelatase subunit H
MKNRAIIVINCMPELMKRTRMGKLDFAKLPGALRKGQRAKGREPEKNDIDGVSLLKSVASWIGRQVRSGKSNGHSRSDYLKWAESLPNLLRFVPNAGRVGDAKNYLLLMSYFLQPTPRNIESMILLALKNYVDDERLRTIEIQSPEALPSVAIYHPDAPELFESFAAYEKWYARSGAQGSTSNGSPLKPSSTIGLLLMRPQIISNSRKHYDALIRAIEAEGLSVIPAISTLMDNRETCEKFFIEGVGGQESGVRESNRSDNGQSTMMNDRRPRISQIVSLTGFSFVGGPAMNDSEAASGYLRELNIPYRSLVSLDAQTIESWRESFTGLNPVQTGMQIAKSTARLSRSCLVGFRRVESSPPLWKIDALASLSV